MSSVYNLEPQPTAKVILKTTSGDILLELFAKQTPLTSRNFLQHCYDGYYNNTIFHRLVPGFIIQGGDPTGTGTGGVSSLRSEGEYFQDEFHSRLKFNRRGLLGMANEGKEGTNGSQFFFTLAATPELQGRNTMFGRVEGDTIYNLMKMADAEVVEGTERPLYPTNIVGTEVLVNPFEDVFTRVKGAPRVREEDGNRKEVKKRKKPAAGKNVLSFGGDEDVDVEMAAPVLKKVKANPKLVAVENETNDRAIPEPAKERKPEKPRKRKTPSPSPEPATGSVPPKQSAPPLKTRESDSRSSSSPEPVPKKTALDKTNAEIAALKASMKRTADFKPEKATKPKNALEAMIPATSTKGRKRGKVTDDKGAMDFFNAWKVRLESVPDTSSPPPATASANGKANGHIPSSKPTTAAADADDDDEAALCDLHFIANCQSCKTWDDEGTKPDAGAEIDGDDDPGWLSHRLTAAKDTLGKDLEWKRKMEEVEVIDPREKMRGIMGERRREKDERKKNR